MLLAAACLLGSDAATAQVADRKVISLTPLEGGVPVTVDGKIIGAVGVSGVTSQQDAQVAAAGAAALLK